MRTTFITPILALLMALLVPSTASAHTRGEAKVKVTIDEEGKGEALMQISDEDALDLLGRTVDEGAALIKEGPILEAVSAAAPAWIGIEGDGRACRMLGAAGERKGMKGLDVVARFDCEGLPTRLAVDWRAGRAAALDLSAIAVIGAPGGVSHSAVLTRAAGRVEVKVSEPAALETFGGFVWLGGEHILVGWDHLAFLLALMLSCGSWRRLVAIVSGFTVAHSVTLALGVTGLLVAPGEVVEAVIALSIAVAAAAALVEARRGRLSYPGGEVKDGGVWLPLGLCFGFGLVHGLGFASMLAEALDGVEGVVAPLLGFNLGVELGQLACVALAFPVLTALGRQRYGERAIGVMLAGLVVLGVAVAIARVV